MKKILLTISTLGILLGLTSCGHTHSLVSHEAKDPTCIEVGYYAYEDCLKCDYTTYEEIEKLDHDLEHYELIESTCLEDGVKEYWYCWACETYFTNEEGTQSIDEENLVITPKEHIDTNNDYVCDYGCGKIFLDKEALQEIIQDTLSLNKVTVKEKYISANIQTTYYFDDNLLYKNIEDGQQENYYYTEEGITYVLTKTNEWTKETTTEVIDYNISYLFDSRFDLEISSEVGSEECVYGFFEGSIMFKYKNSIGIQVDIKLNYDNTLLEGIYIRNEHNAIIYMFEIIYGENKNIYNNLVDIKDYIDRYDYDETTN